LTLIGASRDGVILDGTGTSTTLWAKGIHVTANNVTIKNLTVQNFGAVGYWGYGVLFRDYAHDEESEGYIYYTGGVVDNVKSQNNCYPMYALVNQNLTICNCLIQNNLGDSMFIARGSDGATIHDNVVTNSGDHGIWVGKCWTSPTLPSDNATIHNNTVNGVREGGISFVGSDGASIHNNTITNVAGDGWSVGALSLKDSPSNVDAYDNTIYDNDGSWNGYSGTGHGVGIDGTPSNINLHDNNIYGNTGYGCYNYSTVTVTAKCNWWGDASGPSGSGPGTGDAVSVNVDYSPWLLGPAPDGPCANDIPIDIKPGSDSNSIIPRSKGLIPVVILSTSDWDAPDQVDTESLTFGSTGNEDSLHRRGRAGVPNCGEEDVNGDGLADLVCHFKTQETGFESGDTEGILRGETSDGIPIEGKDSVRIVPSNKGSAVTEQVQVVASPNPVRNVDTATFQVMGTLAAEVEEIRVQIYDLSGRLVWEDAALGSELDWHTDSLSGDYLANGIYLYRVQVRIGGSWINQDIGKIAVLR